MLILASVTVATLTGENGIITKAGEASEQTKIAGYKESIQLSVQYLVMDGSIFGDEDYPEKLEEEMQNYSNLEGAYAERVDSGDVEVTTSIQDDEKVSKIIIDDFRSGKLGNITIERV